MINKWKQGLEASLKSVKERTSKVKPWKVVGFGMSYKGGAILIFILVAVAFAGIGWNVMRGGKDKELATVTDVLGELKIERDKVEYAVKEALGGEGVVCMGDEVPAGFDEGYANERYEHNRLFVGSTDEAIWSAVNFGVPSCGAICAWLDSDGNTVDKFLGFSPEKISAARGYARGEQPFSLIKQQNAYSMISSKRSLLEDKYVFSVCGDNDPFAGIGGARDDHLNCISSQGNIEYIALSKVLSGQTKKEATDALGSIMTSNQSSFYVPVAGDEEVVVISILGSIRIYPIYPLARYPVISELENALPYSITYDWLTDKVTVFKASINGQKTSLGFAGRVYESNIILYDSLTYSWYQQFNGLSVWGDTAGYQLDTLPYQRLAWADAKALENAEFAMLYIGIEGADSLTVRAETYRSSPTINYIVSKTVTDPKKRVEFKGEISNYLGYQLFINE